MSKTYSDPGPQTHWVAGIRHNCPLDRCAECQARRTAASGCWHEAMRDDETGEIVCIHCGEVKR